MNRVTDGQAQDPCAQLSVDEVAVLLKTSVGDVQEQTRRGELVAGRFVVPAGSEVRYPAYQFDPRLSEPVRQCLQLLGPVQTFLFLGSVLAASSLGKCPRVLMILRSRAWMLSIALVV